MKEGLRAAWRLLTFRSSREELQSLGTPNHLIFGLFCTWLVGVGRYWDDPEASLLQHLGVGSVLYVFALAAFLSLAARPLVAGPWSYRNVLAFVTLTSPPAALYAIPVERWVGFDAARSMNESFLLTVAAWRTALWIFFLGRAGGLGPFVRSVTALLPLSMAGAVLSILNLDRVVLNVMGGLRGPQTVNDYAYSTLLSLGFLSVLAFFPLLIVYLVLIGRRANRRKADSVSPPSAS